jgi:hypothetical protein
VVINNPQRGSQWQRWDLHLHTPFTKLANAYKGKDEDGTWDEDKTWDEYHQCSSVSHAFGINWAPKASITHTNDFPVIIAF